MHLTGLMFFVIATLVRSHNDDNWNANDYMKREHSLMKPYTGKLIDLIKLKLPL